MDYSTENLLEGRLRALEHNNNRVTPDLIQYQMERVQVITTVMPGTTTTVATAVLPVGKTPFTLATEISACVDPANFNAQVGVELATQKVLATARNKLWELEGFLLATRLAEANDEERIAVEVLLKDVVFTVNFLADDAGTLVGHYEKLSAKLPFNPAHLRAGGNIRAEQRQIAENIYAQLQAQAAVVAAEAAAAQDVLNTPVEEA